MCLNALTGQLHTVPAHQQRFNASHLFHQAGQRRQGMIAETHGAQAYHSSKKLLGKYLQTPCIEFIFLPPMRDGQSAALQVMECLKTTPSSFHLMSKRSKTSERSAACSAWSQPREIRLHQSCGLCIDQLFRLCTSFHLLRDKHNQLGAKTRPEASPVSISLFLTGSISTRLPSFPDLFFFNFPCG